MKKNILLTLVSLLVFNAAAWGECSVSGKDQSLKKNAVSGDYFEFSYQCATVSFAASYGSTTSLVTGDLIVYEYNAAGTQIKSSSISGIPKGGSSYSVTLQAETRKIKFKNDASTYKISITNIKATSMPESMVIHDVDCGSYTSGGTRTANLTIDYSATTNALYVEQLPSSPFSINCGKGDEIVGVTCNTGTKKLTVTFTASAIGEYKDIVTFRYGTQTITVPIVGYICPTLPAPAEFTVSDASYTSVKGTWTKVEGAQGYRIVNNVNGQYQNVESGETTSATITGLMPDNTYSFTIYPTVNGAPSINGKASGNIKTMATDCGAQEILEITLGKATSGGFNYDDKTSDVTSEKHQPIVSFDYSVSNDLCSGIVFKVQENQSGSWVTKWESTSKSGSSITVAMSRSTTQNKIRFLYSGNFAGYFKNIKIVQTPYVEVSTNTLDFGLMEVGETKELPVTSQWSSIPVNVGSNNTEFKVSPESFGSSYCKNGSQTITVTYTAGAIGTQSGIVTIGDNKVKVSATCVLPKPKTFTADSTYKSVDLSWSQVNGADGYYLANTTTGGHIELDGVSNTTYTWTGLDMNKDYTFTVQARKGTLYSEAKEVSTKTAVLAVPTLSATDVKYNDATLNWNEIEDAGSYRIVCEKIGKDTIINKGYNTLTVTDLALHTEYTFKIISRLPDGTESPLEYNSVEFTTKDLAASASITVSNASYTSVDAEWSAIADATGYYIVSNNGVVNVFEGDVTSGTLVGLMPNNTYTFTIYGMYGEEVSLNGTTSGVIKTLETKCENQTYSNSTVGNATGGGFNWDPKPYEITTEKNSPILNFSFKTSSGAATALGSDSKMFRVKEYVNGAWVNSSWETDSRSGSATVKLQRETRKIQMVFNGNFAATFSNVSVMQGSYLEVPETEIDFGNVSIGENPTKDIVVNYSTMVGNVSVSKEISDKFSIDKNQVGKDDCGYGSENIKVTFDGSEQGAYEGTITVGSVNVKVKANVTLQVPTLTASDITYNSAKLSWNAIDGAEKYKLNFIGGNSIETTDIYSVCDTLKLHSSNQFTVQAYGGGQYTDPSNVVTVNTPDLPVTATFTLSDASYTSMNASWSAVQDATGYAIKNENTGIINYYSSDITSATLVGLTPNTEYTFTLYATYNGELATNGKSAIASTLETKCPAEEFSDKRLGEDCGIFESCAWDWSVKEYVIETERNNPTLNFGYTVASSSTKEKSINAPDVIVYEYKNGGWQELKKVERAKSDHLSLTATDRAVRKFRITFNGNFYCDIKGVSVTQGIYFEVSPESLDFGKVKVGQSVDAKTVSVSFSTMKGDVVSGNEERFNTSKSIVGADDCGYGVETFDVTANTEAEAGTYESSVTVGSQAIPVKITIEKLPATNVSAAATGKSAISVQWDKVSGATGYKLTCADAGIDVTIPDTGSEHYSYNATGLDESTQYTFTITTMYNAIENESASASATTYATVNVIAAGDAIATTEWTLTGIEGKWNKTENSFEIGSNVTIFASNSDANVIFDKIQYYDGESTVNPTTITVLDGSVAQTWAGVYFKYSGVAKTDDGEVFQTLNDAVEYSKTHAVSEITLLTDRASENLDVTSGSNITINGQGFKVGNVTVESDAKLTTSGALIMGNLNIKTEYRNSGEVDPDGQNLDVIGTVSFDKILDPSGKVNSNNWYAVCVPFDVNVSDIRGLDADGNEHVMVWDKDYIVDEYNGTKRAATGKGWFDLSANSVLTPGKMYIVAAIKYNTWRFYKTAGSPIVSNLTSITLNEFESSNIKNQGWNAIGNSQIFHVDLSTETEFGQVLVNGKKTYDIVKLSEESFAVAAPLFIQYASGSKDVNLSMKSHGSLRSVSVDNETFNLRIAGSNSTEHADQLFLTASEYASEDYVIGKDLVKMGDLTGVSDARIWMKAKSANLCVMDAKLTDGVTVIPLGIYVPKSGNYDFYLNSFADGVKLELLYNGEIIHNFADGSFSTAIAKGTNDSYSLKVSVDADAPVVTDADEVDGVKAYIAENILYIKGLNSGAEYTVYALQNKIASGVADGGVEQIALPAQGVYVVVSGETTIKLLNK